ncbi:RpiB/LacA/LacB family sugar-phosphate isomerase [Shinella daejeonensis]|uniref:RpiB/LacA/LacB family sugar-phosphate isomerase n=1 Tax=Shinella daejeonensis TaxID=659017 RepID=UPI0020C8093C|nr:RpiB/LacA/LacB family sugar-phosphate isomerase [Shinella daejeonensis]
MRLILGADHAGYQLLDVLRPMVADMAEVVATIGATSSEDTVDYPDIAIDVAKGLRAGTADRAIIICGSGVGAVMACNKQAGLYAGLCHDTYSARQGVQHDNMNVVCLGARIIGVEAARDVIRAFLGATFGNEERHLRRIRKMQEMESWNIGPNSRNPGHRHA